MSWPPKDLVLNPGGVNYVDGRGVTAPKKRRRNKAPEADLQRAVVQYLRLALPRKSGIFWSATMNGARLPTEAARRKAKEQGLNAGVPDLVFIVLLPTPGLRVGDTYFIELKAPSGSLSPEQKAIIRDALFPAGRGAVARSVTQVCAALTAWGMPLRATVYG